MEFLNPTALYGLLGLPLLLIPYLLRRRPRRQEFSSLLLFMDAGMQAEGRPWGRIRIPPIFLLQLLLLTLLILSLSEPVFSVRPQKIALVIDNSASMQALENGRPRIELAKQQARDLVNALDAVGRADVYRTAPRMERLHGQPLSRGEAVAAIDAVTAVDLGETPLDYNAALTQLATELKYERVYIITDHPASGQNSLIRIVRVGQSQSNLAVTSFEVRRPNLGDEKLEALITVANYSGSNQTINVNLTHRGKSLARKELSVAADQSQTVTIAGFAAQPDYAVEIEPRDALPLDNRRYAVAPGSQQMAILAVSPRPAALESFRHIPGVKIDVVAPNDYGTASRVGYGLEIFHLSAPAALPSNPALFILPPDSLSLADLGAPAANVPVTGWRDSHAVTRYVNFSLFRPSYARPLKPQVPGDVLIDSGSGALAFGVERLGKRHLVLGFDPFPYLGRENLPMSIFTLNLLDWFFEDSRQSSGATGTPLALGKVAKGDTIVTPKDQTISLSPAANYFADTLAQGIYQLKQGSQTTLIARNLNDSQESDLRAPAPIPLAGSTAGSQSTSVLNSFWPYLLLAFVTLLLLEWFINPHLRLRRQPQRSPLGQRT